MIRLFLYGVAFLVLGLAIIISAIATDELDEIELSTPGEMVTFVLFICGICFLYFGAGCILSVMLPLLTPKR